VDPCLETEKVHTLFPTLSLARQIPSFSFAHSVESAGVIAKIAPLHAHHVAYLGKCIGGGTEVGR
jgi:hypothetical protein